MSTYDIREILWERGEWLRKYVASPKSRMSHEGPASHLLGEVDGYIGNAFLPQKIYAVPNEEFLELAYDLPYFEDMPLLWLAWCSSGKPTTFIIQNLKDGDTIAVDTQGYEYARYRASCKRMMPVV